MGKKVRGFVLNEYQPMLGDDDYVRFRWKCLACGHLQEYHWNRERKNPCPQKALVVFTPSEYTLRGSIILLSALQAQVYDGFADPGVVYRVTGGRYCKVVQDGKKQRLEEVEWPTRKAC